MDIFCVVVVGAEADYEKQPKILNKLKCADLFDPTL